MFDWFKVMICKVYHYTSPSNWARVKSVECPRLSEAKICLKEMKTSVQDESNFF